MKKIYLFLSIFTALTMIVFSVLSFANPQWGSIFYRYQAYMWPANVELHEVADKTVAPRNKPQIPLPENYSGEWNSYHENGQLYIHTYYDRGDIDGLYVELDSKGEVVVAAEKLEGELRTGLYMKREGGVTFFSSHRRGAYLGFYQARGEEGRLIDMGIYLDHPVRKVPIYDEYREIDVRTQHQEMIDEFEAEVRVFLKKIESLKSF